ncbi:hypothetical protein MUN84_22630 (plasmid) [Hymenobacter sp. 5516J-16]|uniref:hypothetical protein n=1 Tax=Hymenobacter sp. 5516J-16 TaxID=2932253 RepID=UPI001FD5EBB1|nr:hypothetical protein [Hymenobacter sp. 5516J-16]UOQ79247.1 hypothetical protein MUN84_22630 [Hymenobacter sp. 5516J-16]
MTEPQLTDMEQWLTAVVRKGFKPEYRHPNLLSSAAPATTPSRSWPRCARCSRPYSARAEPGPVHSASPRASAGPCYPTAPFTRHPPA